MLELHYRVESIKNGSKLHGCCGLYGGESCRREVCCKLPGESFFAVTLQTHLRTKIDRPGDSGIIRESRYIRK